MLRNISFNRANSLSKEIEEFYGLSAIECFCDDQNKTWVISESREFDLIELEQLLESVGWSRRPTRRVKKALENSLIKIGLWQHDPKFPRLIGFARCTGDGVLEATVWDVAIHPIYQSCGLGKQLMDYLLIKLKEMGVERVTLFADPGVISFYERQGWVLEPKGCKCAFWYAT